MRIYDCKTNHLQNPIGFALEKLSFSWKVDGVKGKKQTGARIKVSGNEEMTDILADSGWSETASSLGTKLEMKTKGCTRYYWTVAVRTDEEEESESAVQFFETGKQEEPWIGMWIKSAENECAHPKFTKEIHVKSAVKQARLYICGLGLYEASVDGQKVGKEYLTPYLNDYNSMLQYQTFDVTEMFGGKNETRHLLSVVLGNGWYNGRYGSCLGITGKDYYSQGNMLIAELKLEYEDGSAEVIGTDTSWDFVNSNLSFSDIYDGEKRDDTLKETYHGKAVPANIPRGKLTERFSLPVAAHEVIRPIELIVTPLGEKVLDLGQEISGIFRLKVHEPVGSRIRLQFGEVLQKGCFY